MFKEFKAFVMRGNVIDLAVAFIMGAAFGKITTSLVNDVVMPPIGFVLGKVDFNKMFINLSDKSYATLADAQAAGAPTIRYGMFINTVLDFVIVAAVMFFLVRTVNRMQKPKPAPAAAPTTKECPFCVSTIPIKATRCPNCTSELKT
jgi:large conductance mechanosensitive channel